MCGMWICTQISHDSLVLESDDEGFIAAINLINFDVSSKRSDNCYNNQSSVSKVSDFLTSRRVLNNNNTSNTRIAMGLTHFSNYCKM